MVNPSMILPAFSILKKNNLVLRCDIFVVLECGNKIFFIGGSNSNASLINYCS